MAKEENINDYFEAFGSRIIHCHFVDGNPTGHMAWEMAHDACHKI